MKDALLFTLKNMTSLHLRSTLYTKNDAFDQDIQDSRQRKRKGKVLIITRNNYSNEVLLNAPRGTRAAELSSA